MRAKGNRQPLSNKEYLAQVAELAFILSVVVCSRRFAYLLNLRANEKASEMSYIPQPGDTNVHGSINSAFKRGGGICIADAVPGNAGSQWAGPPMQNNPLVFEYIRQAIIFCPGDRIIFDVVQGNYAPMATNLRRE